LVVVCQGRFASLRGGLRPAWTRQHQPHVRGFGSERSRTDWTPPSPPIFWALSAFGFYGPVRWSVLLFW